MDFPERRVVITFSLRQTRALHYINKFKIQTIQLQNASNLTPGHAKPKTRGPWLDDTVASCL